MDMLLASERGATRRAVRVDCQVVRAHDFTLLGETGLDLSSDGMFLLSTVPVFTGEEVLVSFRVPGTDRIIDTSATVARVVHGRRQWDRARGMGLRFAPLDPEDERYLRWVLRRMPPPLPTRAIRVDYAATASMIALS
ncbi:PilZ domain-containing protein [Chondromyces crocatus]|uniref:PilZ domain-containing protein n=1 Tax=Chondromyces crocatus TaxID=52 RepID=A0A0K1EKY3_CHOCO|nr:PilZ domain-containing protein [Chondromyces crocatus]AKT41486.1 uncharacterized protein CMC5_056940 [Chondromyces crocatus]